MFSKLNISEDSVLSDLHQHGSRVPSERQFFDIGQAALDHRDEIKTGAFCSAGSLSLSGKLGSIVARRCRVGKMGLSCDVLASVK